MKHRTLTIGFIFVLGCSLAYSQSRTPVKHALVVGISEYSPSSGFRRIDADNDLRIICKLLKQQGFTDTLYLGNSQATKSGFISAFKKLQSNVLRGDVVFIHFSTHGQQIQDLDGDEADGMDEAIALYDAKARGGDGYTGQNHLTDDEFGPMVDQLRRKLGKEGDILVLIDACHSGSMTRGVDTTIIRGGYAPIEFAHEKKALKTRGGGDEIENRPAQLSDKNKVGMFSSTTRGEGDDQSNYVILSACENSEVSSEYYYNHNYYGPLTWAFLNAILHNNSNNYTYSKLFYDIQYEMISMFENYKTKQSPTITTAEKEGEDRVIFGGQVVNQQRFNLITKFQSPDRFLINGGNISGVFDSTVVLVFPAGTPDPRKAGNPVAKGLVARSGYLESLVVTDSPLDIKKPGDYWVFLADRKLGGNKVSVGLGGFTNENLRKLARTELGKCSFIETGADIPAFILEQKKNTAGEMVLEHGRSKKLYKDHITAENLNKALLNLAQVQFLKSLEASAEGIDMEVCFKPVDTTRYSRTRFIDPGTLRNTVKEISDTAVLWIVNTGKKPFYFNIVDIDPEDHCTLILPTLRTPVSECYLKPGQKFHTANTFSRPYGTETLKILASEKKFDLQPVINCISATRGTLGELEGLFNDAYQMRGAPSLPESAEFATFNFVFDIIK